MKYKALMIDLDGTTVIQGSHIVRPRVVEAVKAADAIIHVGIATGRILPGALPIIDQLSLSAPCILDQGAQIYDPVQKKIVRELSLEKTLVEQALNIFTSYTPDTRIFDGHQNALLSSIALPEKVVGIFVLDIEDSIAEKLVSDLGNIPGIAVHKMVGMSADVRTVEVTNIGATKQHGISEVAGMLGISAHEIIAVGDGYNDFPLLMACGLKVAMGNAVPELKAIADFIAPTVDEDGVATVIEKFVLAA